MNMYDENKNHIMMAAVVGAITGAVAALLVNDNKREKIHNTLMDAWDSVKDLKQKGKKKLENEIDQTESKIETARK